MTFIHHHHLSRGRRSFSPIKRFYADAIPSLILVGFLPFLFDLVKVIAKLFVAQFFHVQFFLLLKLRGTVIGAEAVLSLETPGPNEFLVVAKEIEHADGGGLGLSELELTHAVSSLGDAQAIPSLRTIGRLIFLENTLGAGSLGDVQAESAIILLIIGVYIELAEAGVLSPQTADGRLLEITHLVSTLGHT